jgi:hypothetical protein
MKQNTTDNDDDDYNNSLNVFKIEGIKNSVL